MFRSLFRSSAGSS